MKHSSRWALTALAMAFAGMAQAGVLYSNNAGTPFVQSFDTTTGLSPGLSRWCRRHGSTSRVTTGSLRRTTDGVSK